MAMGCVKIFARKGGVGKIGGLSGNKGLPYYTEVLLRIPHDASQEKNLNVYFSFVNNYVLQNNCSNNT